MEISERVRRRGMIFGLWFEPERAVATARAVQEHPDDYIDGTLLDFGKPSAVDRMLNVIGAQIKKYDIGWVKFDFNATILLDPSGNAFYRYMQGQRRFIEELRRRFPDLYITNCASGGYRMEVEQGTLCDSFWLSDNQGPYEGIRIVKDTLKRMPTALIERRNVQKYVEGMPNYGTPPVGRMLSCNNAGWDFVINVDDSFTTQFINCGPIGFSMDLCAMPDHVKALWKRHVAKFKAERAFYQKATARILVDSDDVIAIEYADPKLTHCELQLFTKTVYTDTLTLYPAVDVTCDYELDGHVVSGAELAENGIRFEKPEDNRCYTAFVQNHPAP